MRLRPSILSREAGIALMAVLWVLLLLSGLAASAMYVATANAIVTHRTLDLARMQSAADTAIVATIDKLSDEHTARHVPVDGSAITETFDAILVTVYVTHESGRIDVNSVSDELLLAFLESQAVSEERAKALIQSLRAWQDPERSAIHRGAPLTRPLASLEELRRIPGWNTPELDCWLDSFTIYTELSDVTTAHAPPRVLAALRRAQTYRAGSDTAIARDATATRAEPAQLGDVLRVQATANASNKVRAVGQWIGRLTGDPTHPTLTMQWGFSPVSEPVNCASGKPPIQ